MNVLLCHLFGHQNYAVGNGDAGNWAANNGSMDVAYNRATDGKERMSSKDNTVMMKQEEPFSWTGLYIGGNAGAVWTDYGFNSFNSDVDLGAQANEGFNMSAFDTGVDLLRFGTPGFASQSDSSLTAGGQAGYSYQFGHFASVWKATSTGRQVAPRHVSPLQPNSPQFLLPAGRQTSILKLIFLVCERSKATGMRQHAADWVTRMDAFYFM